MSRVGLHHCCLAIYKEEQLPWLQQLLTQLPLMLIRLHQGWFGLQFEEQNRSKSRAENRMKCQIQEVNLRQNNVCCQNSKERLRDYLTLKLQKKANLNYKLNFYGIARNQTHYLLCDKCMTDNSKVHHCITAHAWWHTQQQQHNTDPFPESTHPSK